MLRFLGTCFLTVVLSVVMTSATWIASAIANMEAFFWDSQEGRWRLASFALTMLGIATAGVLVQDDDHPVTTGSINRVLPTLELRGTISPDDEASRS